MKYGFIPIDVIPTEEWYIIDEYGIIISRGGPGHKGLENVFCPGNTMTQYWVDTCSRWYDTMELLCEAHTSEML